MEFERLEQVWRSQANRPSEELQARLTEELMSMLKTRRRTEALLATIPIAAMTLFTVTAGAIVLRDGTAFRGWFGLAMMGVCWAVILTVLWASFRARSRNGDQPVRDVLARRLARNRNERRGFRVFWMMTPVFFMPMWIALQGRGDGSVRWQAVALCGIAVIASLGWNTLRFFLALKPEQRRLEALLGEYE